MGQFDNSLWYPTEVCIREIFLSLSISVEKHATTLSSILSWWINYQQNLVILDSWIVLTLFNYHEEPPFVYLWLWNNNLEKNVTCHLFLIFQAIFYLVQSKLNNTKLLVLFEITDTGLVHIIVKFKWVIHFIWISKKLTSIFHHVIKW